MSATVLPNERYIKLKKPEGLQEPIAPSYFSELIRVAFSSKAKDQGGAVLFTAPHRGCGVSYFCSYIAAELALAGNKVLLADAEAILALAKRDSVDIALCERIGPGRVWVLGMKQVQGADIPGIDLRNMDLHNVDRCSLRTTSSPMTVLELLTQEFSHVVIDAPALAVSDAALTLSAAVLGCVFVAEAGQTEKRQIIEAHKKFISLGARVFGCIYNAQ